jgi:hypothetical protein
VQSGRHVILLGPTTLLFPYFKLAGQIFLVEGIQANELEALADNIQWLIELFGAEGDGVASDL